MCSRVCSLFFSKRAAEEVKRYESTILELTRKTDRSEIEIRKEFHKQMTEALAQRQQLYEDEKNDGLNQLKFIYDEKVRFTSLRHICFIWTDAADCDMCCQMAAFREELEKVGHELESEKQSSKRHRTGSQHNTTPPPSIDRSLTAKRND